MKKTIFFYWVSLTWLTLASAQISNVWQVTYDYQGRGAGAVAIDFDGDNNIVIGSVALDTLGISNMVTLKYNNNGNFLWQSEYSYSQFTYEMVYDINIAPDNSIIVAGMANNEWTDDYAVLKYNAEGTFQWSDLYDVSYQDLAGFSAINSAGEIYVGGNTHGHTSYITKYSPAGTIIWRDTLPYIQGSIYALMLDEDENLYVSGYVRQPPNYIFKPMLCKLNPDGEIIWVDIFDDTTVYDGGLSRMSGFLAGGIPIAYMGTALIAYNPTNGARLWEAPLPSQSTYWPKIALSPNRDHIAVIGKSSRYLRYYDAAGNMLWHVQRNNFLPANKLDIQIAPNGVIYWLTRDSLYAYGTDGSLLHTHVFEDIVPKFIRFDPENYMYVTGDKELAGTNYDVLGLEKYEISIADNLPVLPNSDNGAGLFIDYTWASSGLVHFYMSSPDSSVPAVGSLLRLYDICGREVHNTAISNPSEGYNWYWHGHPSGLYIALWEQSGRVLGRCKVFVGR